MTDKTTEGITAAPEEVEAVLLNLCGYHLAESDPVFRYTVLTREQVLYDALVTAIKRERGRALAEMVEKGHKLTEVAELTGLGSRQRVQRLIQLAKVEKAVAEVQAASREFDERMAAVEATLDEVVSGIALTENAMVLAKVTDDFAEVEAFDKGLDQGLDGAEGAYHGRHAGRDEFPPNAEFDAPVVDEATRVIPTLATLMPQPTDEVPWWRRNRDSGAA